MVKSTKSETSQKSETKQEASTKVKQPTTEPSAEKKVRAKKTKSAATTVSSAPSENVVISATPAVAAVASTVASSSTATTPATTSTAPVSVTESKLAVMFTEFFDKLHKTVGTLSALKSEFKLLEKYANKELRALQKSHKKKGGNAGNRSPSGFVKPTLISNELASFLGKASGSEMARTEVTREINVYIRANSLQDKSNGRQINADDKLAALLKLKDGDVLTYFNLQKFMSCHFAKISKAVPTATASV
jgi:chromatin remodeling complex protein RSC6